MNKDLEIIKSEVDFIDKYMADHELDERLNAILVHAERMAAEIERLKKIIHLCDYCQKEYPTCDAPKDIDFGRGKGNDNVVRCAAFVNGRNLWAEIARLKAELEKRPEVVRCGECRKRNMLFQCPISEANALIKQLEKKPSTKPFIELTDNCFCSNGQRRESEEGK